MVEAIEQITEGKRLEKSQKEKEVIVASGKDMKP
tara:strand:+ start:132 stop:233 length:102 start_codon:yes stop_codon:yes gene_type:complete